MPHAIEDREGNGKLSSSTSSLNGAEADEAAEEAGAPRVSALFALNALRYEGETSDGQYHGEGVVCFEGGHVYKGMFSMGLMDGVGVFTWADGVKYEGDFVCNMPMGHGAYTWPDGSSYEGDVHNGLRQGNGTYKSATNAVSYSGQWHQSKRHGKGAVYYNQDKTSWYKGDWVMNNREGWGVRCYPSGNTYSGQWNNNLRNGEGTMKWLNTGQEYVGEWKDGLPHGRGRHVWIMRRMLGSQYCQSNQYTGEFVRGQRHGQGTFHYAGGAVYQGQWRNNKKHGQGTFTFKDGQSFEGEFVEDRMITPNLGGNQPPNLHCAFPQSGKEPPVVGQDMIVNIQRLLDKFPEAKRDSETKQVEFVVLRHNNELKSIYSFYSRLGHAECPDNIFLLSRMQLWRLLKDCHIHHHGITLTQLEFYIREDSGSEETDSPFTPVRLCQFLRYLVITAYHLYRQDMVSQKYPLAACFCKLVTEDILPNAKNVKGFLFREPGRAVVAERYFMKCWEIYQTYSTVSGGARCDSPITCRHLLWIFKDLGLFDSKLTTGRSLEIITAESSDIGNPSSCMDQEITFLEFFEALLGCAEAKYKLVPEDSDSDLSPSCTDEESGENSSEEEAAVSSAQTAAAPVESPTSSDDSNLKSSDETGLSDASELGSAQQVDIQQELDKTSQSAEHTDEENDTQAISEQDKSEEADLWTQMLHQFFHQFFFPAFDHHQLVSRYMTENTQDSD